jgi:calcyphosin
MVATVDRDKSGYIDIDELLVGIRGDLNSRRQRLVKMAFDILDTDRSGIITIDEMLDRYDFSEHPEVKSGKKTKKEAMREFIGRWDRSRDGEVTWEEFLDYYKELSASIDGDDYFELMIRNAWRIAGGEGAAANTANRRVLVTNRDGSQSVQTIQNELGMKGRDVDDVRRRLGQQGVPADKVELFGGYEDVQSGRAGRTAPVVSDRLID